MKFVAKVLISGLSKICEFALLREVAKFLMREDFYSVIGPKVKGSGFSQRAEHDSHSASLNSAKTHLISFAPRERARRPYLHSLTRAR